MSSFHSEASKYIEFWSIFWKWWSIVFVVWLTKETLKTLYSFRSIVRNSQHYETPENAEIERRTNLAHWNGVANSYLVCHVVIVFHSKWVKFWTKWHFSERRKAIVELVFCCFFPCPCRQCKTYKNGSGFLHIANWK